MTTTTTTAPPKKAVGKERLLRKTSLGAQYVETDYNGQNESGWHPIGDTVLVMCDKPVTKTSGGIIITETMQEAHRAAAETGVVVEIADGAFLWNSDGTRFEGYKPRPGDRICFTRYAGQLHIGADGLEYRIMEAKCIGAVQEDDVQANSSKGSKRS